MYFKENLETIFGSLENIIKAKTVFGEPLVVNDITLIPVVNVAFGVGAGGGESNDDGAGALGAGTGAKLTPSAIVVIKNDEVSLLSLGKKNNMDALVEMIPSIINKIQVETDKEIKFEDDI